MDEHRREEYFKRKVEATEPRQLGKCAPAAHASTGDPEDYDMEDETDGNPDSNLSGTDT